MSHAQALQNERPGAGIAIPRENADTATNVVHLPDDTVVSIYENEIPAFVAGELDRLYNNLYAALDQLTLDGPLHHASTYVARKDGKITNLFLFRREKGLIRVLNQSMAPDQEEIERFAKAVFARFRFASTIVFHAIQATLDGPAFPYQRFPCAQEIVAALPATKEEYLAQLGKNMREKVKRYTNKIKRTFPTFSFEVYTQEDIDESLLAEIYRLHRARILSKNEVSNIDDRIYRHIVQLAKKRGLVTVARIDGRICGGLICFRTGHSYQMRMIAHDLKYDEFKMGSVCCYHTINECIARGGKTFDFMAGSLLYKFRFLGIEKDFDQVTIYRSTWHRLWQLPHFLKTAWRGNLQKFKLWLRNVEQRHDVASRCTVKLWHAWRVVKERRMQARVAREMAAGRNDAPPATRQVASAPSQ